MLILSIYSLHFKHPLLFCFAYTWIGKAVHDSKIVVSIQYSIAQFFFYRVSQPYSGKKRSFTQFLVFIPIVVWFLFKHCIDFQYIPS